MSQKTSKEGPRLSKNQRFSEHFSIHCCPPFTFLNSKREIVDRKYSICKSGCFYQKKEEDWICCACQKTRPSRRATSPQRPKHQPAAPPAVVRAPAKPRSPPRRSEPRSPPRRSEPRSPPRSERQPRPRPEVRPPPAKQRPPQKSKPPAPQRSSPQRGPGTSRGGSPIKASRFW
ncbi:PREDICTED: myelin-associated oligodendrocyte basic protein isoform X1 [Hipposideros armiger]|uniref:Myelin-associated oligodendrocyte basic protein isoform X1 n=2 Tax=Hipposideros armiger TaxID=186990 RepID=A0A8B7SZS5_HIPAR|nr:PREDICTED: myelin-associated oligodendrocyte basic protein isoform X1 [Hipposideros armiger]XP_019518319.1 PREDICTED: myelin-associated oligodendrocyte basic protein isoform X1 [Hipposideros armiger]XP_019518320.1 PREDICTED: myelin-associated oligodendrocyte basic protein isoform X1 [Hipposideros armiger]XP_019518321.1 PREDICTED: myelin-associated oligodendrocyte basic protein isoform X1 [Hipposideros armiger]XP_019518322.1 PREDICTED: myelin-associated oligodendrocyte basic protein isoform X